MDLLPDELKAIKSFNSKVKGPGGKVTISWNIAHKIENIAFEANIIGETLYNSNPLSSHRESELRD